MTDTAKAKPRQRPDREFGLLVNADLRDKYAAGTAYETLSRPENLVRWLHHLEGIRESIKLQRSTAKAALDAHPDKPIDGAPPPESYIRAKQEMQERNTARARTMQAVVGRIAEVRRLIGMDLIPEQAIGDVIGELMLIRRHMQDGRSDNAVRTLENLISTLQQGRRQ